MSSQLTGPAMKSWPGPGFPTFVLQPILNRIVNRIGAQHREVFARLGPHTKTSFLIDPTDLPFALHLMPDPEALKFRAVSRTNPPAHGAGVAGTFLTLLRLMDSDVDGDALFFSGDLTISGNTEAVVSLRNALDDVEGSIAGDVADMFGPVGRFALKKCRDAAGVTNS